MSKYIYGIDIGGTSIKIGLFSIAGTLINKWEIPTDISNNGNNIVNDIYHSISNNTIDLKDIIGYGFGVPGPVINGVVIECINLGWETTDLKSTLKDLFNNDNIFTINDANAAALGEAWQGSSKDFKNSVMITIGTGVGGGVIVDGKIVNGFNGAGGEIGHMLMIHQDGYKCNCGNHGCLETVASATGMKRMFCDELKVYENKSVLNCIDQPSTKMIFDAARKGDEVALSVVEDVSYYLAYTAQILSVITNPGVIIIGGGVSKAGDFLINKIREKYNYIAFSQVKETKIVVASLGNDAGIYGAASMVFDKI
ncbi:MAG: ROK family glucokinase [Candidatus Izemoplasma sp.]